MQPDTLTDVLSGRHFNMAERLERGLWPHPPLRYAELIDHVASLVDRHGHFPRPYVAHVPGEAVDEGIVIERRAPQLYVALFRRGQAADCYTIAEEATRAFSSAQAAADFYLRWEHGLPGNLDGWVVLP